MLQLNRHFSITLLASIFSFFISSKSVFALANGEVCVYENSKIGWHYCECNHACNYEITKDGGTYKISANAYHTVGYGYTCDGAWPDDKTTKTDEGCQAILPEMLAVLTPSHLSDPGRTDPITGLPLLTCGNIHSYTATFIADPTPTPLPTPTKTITPPTTPQVSAGGPYLNIPCVAGNTSVEVAGSVISSNKDNLYKLLWSSDCRDAVIDDKESLKTKILFKSTSAENKPNNCKVSLSLTDSYNRTVTSSAEVVVNSCNIDCKGVINGDAKTDVCGVCSGDGSSCAGCSSVDISSTQLKSDSTAAAQRNLVIQANSIILNAKKKQSSKSLEKLQSKLNKFSARAHKLYQTSWILSYIQPNVVLQCAASANCVSLSNTSSEISYLDNSAKFTSILNQQIRLLSSSNEVSAIKKIKKLIRKSINMEKISKNVTSQLPDIRSSCNF